jgi:hypothetical protein
MEYWQEEKQHIGQRGARRVICIYNCDAIVRPDVAGDRLSIMLFDIPARAN